MWERKMNKKKLFFVLKNAERCRAELRPTKKRLVFLNIHTIELYIERVRRSGSALIQFCRCHLTLSFNSHVLEFQSPINVHLIMYMWVCMLMDTFLKYHLKCHLLHANLLLARVAYMMPLGIFTHDLDRHDMLTMLTRIAFLPSELLIQWVNNEIKKKFQHVYGKLLVISFD